MPNIPNDNISESLKNIVGGLDKKFKDSEEFLDIISWNLRWFDDKNPTRVQNIVEVLSFLNADIFVFQEIQNNSLDIVATKLVEMGAGNYTVFYGTTGGDQRVAIMYDKDWIRAKDDIQELFGKGMIKTGDNKDVFPRLPFYGFFLARSPRDLNLGFTFQLIGLHLKSQVGGGSSQRIIAAEKLSYWLQTEGELVDADVIMIGDWNKSPDDNDWAAIHKLEKAGKVKFKSINDTNDFSHLYYERKTKLGSRLDIALVSTSMATQMKNRKTKVIRWVTINELLKSADELKTTEIKAILNTIKEEVSDHMPLFSRYYLRSNDPV